MLFLRHFFRGISSKTILPVTRNPQDQIASWIRTNAEYWFCNDRQSSFKNNFSLQKYGQQVHAYAVRRAVCVSYNIGTNKRTEWFFCALYVYTQKKVADARGSLRNSRVDGYAFPVRLRGCQMQVRKCWNIFSIKFRRFKHLSLRPNNSLIRKAFFISASKYTLTLLRIMYIR